MKMHMKVLSTVRNACIQTDTCTHAHTHTHTHRQLNRHNEYSRWKYVLTEADILK